MLGSVSSRTRSMAPAVSEMKTLPVAAVAATNNVAVRHYEIFFLEEHLDSNPHLPQIGPALDLFPCGRLDHPPDQSWHDACLLARARDVERVECLDDVVG